MIVEFIKALIRFLTNLSMVAFAFYVMMCITGFTFLEIVLLFVVGILGLIIGIFLIDVITWAFS